VIETNLKFFHSIGVATWWTKIFQGLDLQSDAYSLSFYHTLAQIPGMMLASGLIDIVGRRRLVITGFGGGSVVLLLLSMFAKSVGAYKTTTRSAIALGLACCYSVCLCVGWLALDCLSAESFPTKVRSTGRGVCVATGRIAGFSIQFLYGPLINENRLSYMLGIACLFAVCGVIISYQTTDTTYIDLQDHWECGHAVELPNDDERRKSYSSVQCK
jgi:MFS family permease